MSNPVESENVAAPSSHLTQDDPTPHEGKQDTVSHDEQMFLVAPAASLIGAFNAYSGKCVCGKPYDNNCAHYLADAFIRAGYTEIQQSGPFQARCTSKRPIRAREMWAWFQSKAVKTSRTPQRNTGVWAVFQLKESQYWGGHVLLFDTDSWTYRGTGYYPDWDQYLYQF